MSHHHQTGFLSGSVGLIASLVALHLVSPIISMISPAADRFFVFAGFLGVLLTGVIVLGRHRARVILAVCLSLPTIGVGLWVVLTASPTGDLVLGVAAIPMMVYTASVAFAHVLRGRRVGIDRLAGIAAVFLLMAFIWTGLYAWVELVSPNSFRTPQGDRPDLDDLSYFSLVTQTTLGYGDMAPLHPIARSFATLQAVAGLFYMGVIVARFVGTLDHERLKHRTE